MEKGTWRGDWPARIHRRVRALGFESLTALAERYPTATLLELAMWLGDDVVAIQIEGVLYAEAEKTGEHERFARDLLVRRLRQRLPMGWSVDESLAFERTHAFASWATAVQGLIGQAACDAIWDTLERADIPPGWLPEGPDDPFIQQAFAGVRFDAPADTPSRGGDA